MQVHVPIEEFLDWIQGFFLGFAPLVHITTTGQTRAPPVGRTGSLYGVIQTNLTSFFPSGRVSRSSDVAITGDPRSCVCVTFSFFLEGGAELRRPRNEEFKVRGQAQKRYTSC